MNDCLDSYIKNWSHLLKVCEENRDEMDAGIANLVKNFGLKRNAEDFPSRLKPISIALDRSQRDACGIADPVDIWKQLRKDFTEKKQPAD